MAVTAVKAKHWEKGETVKNSQTSGQAVCPQADSKVSFNCWAALSLQ